MLRRCMRLVNSTKSTQLESSWRRAGGARDHALLSQDTKWQMQQTCAFCCKRAGEGTVQSHVLKIDWAALATSNPREDSRGASEAARRCTSFISSTLGSEVVPAGIYCTSAFGTRPRVRWVWRKSKSST